MELHTCMLCTFADDIAALDVKDITIVLSSHLGMGMEDYDELKTIMAERHSTIRLRYSYDQ